MGKGDHPVLLALPDGDWDPDLRQLEAPVANESEVIVEPAADAAGNGAARCRRHKLGEVAGQGASIDLGDQPAKGGSNVRPGYLCERLRLILQPRLKRRLTLD